MNLTLLLDLDDTLLENDIYKFLPHYLNALGKHLSHHVAPDHMARELLRATEAMAANNQAGVTLEEAFDEKFYPAIALSKSLLKPPLLEFYENIFPTLSYLTRPVPAAINLVETAMKLGLTVAVATNPLFPIRAIEHRLAWARLPIERFPFSLISSFETFHFAKPNPAFLAECLARLGWPSQPAVMVGNSLSDDLIPAAKLGIPGFLVNDPDHPVDLSQLPRHSQQGSLESVIDWLQDISSSLSSPEYHQPEAILAVLKSTPAVIDTFGRSISPERWNKPPQSGEWCFTEIICHLRDADKEINLPRLEKILSEENSFIPAVNADAWSETRGYCQEAGEIARAGFMRERGSLIQRLEGLTSEQWETPASHAIFGPTTLRELAAFIAQHDRTHVQQAIKTIQSSSNLSDQAKF